MASNDNSSHVQSQSNANNTNNSNAILDTLSDDQRQCLHEFCTVTNEESIEAAVRILKSREWNVQFAIQAFYEPGYTDQQLAASTESSENDVTQGDSQVRRRRNAAGTQQEQSIGDTAGSDSTDSVSRNRPTTIAAVVPAFSWFPLFTWPFHLVFRVSTFMIKAVLTLVGLQRIASAGIPGGRNVSSSGSGSGSDPASRDAAEFRRYFEESFGTDHPPFFTGTYARALEAARRDLKYLLVVVWSKEHDNARLFGQVLTHPDLVSYLSQREFLVWVGDVSCAEAFGVATTLGATRYPFIALGGYTSQLYPATGIRQGGERYKLKIFVRLDGLPSDIPSDTLARSLIRTIRGPVERVNQTLSAARREQQEREAARRIVEQQDRAYQESLARDKERERQMRERDELERTMRESEERRLEEEKRKQDLVKQWKWATFARIQSQEPVDINALPKGAAGKLNLRLEDGTRTLTVFSAEATLQDVFDFVETRDVAAEWEASGGKAPYGEDDLALIEMPEDYEHEYDFALVSQFPRAVFEDRAANLKEQLSAKGLWPSAALIVEPLFEPEE
ncbi:Ubx domain-containing protein [Coemansia sp. RSA 1722]|nr:Ubx domain-containing protein [Coemansia sp. RSA 486]KAJ2234436.1 UBX domain-containing protein 10 [Coemansia sp. RSA 485]KAJ2604707.1 Ubx domain-containing protein [Coemansia sp. RSA 1722]